MPNKWITALKEWNTEKGGPWCVPRKGSPEYDEVKGLMSGTRETVAQKTAREERNKSTMSKALEGLRKVEAETKQRNVKRKVEAFRAKEKSYMDASIAKKTKAFEFSNEPEGIAGFVQPFYDVKKISFWDVKKKDRELIAKMVLTKLFPGATRVDSLTIGSFATPAQVDGGIQVSMKGKSLTGSLIYEDYDYTDTDALYKITKEVLKPLKFEEVKAPGFNKTAFKLAQ